MNFITKSIRSVEAFISGPLWYAAQVLFSKIYHDEMAACIPIARAALHDVLEDPRILTNEARLLALAGRTGVLLARAQIQVAEEAVHAASAIALMNAVHGGLIDKGTADAVSDKIAVMTADAVTHVVEDVTGQPVDSPDAARV